MRKAARVRDGSGGADTHVQEAAETIELERQHYE